MAENGSIQASSYASGFMSNIYPNRQVPDVCGMVGMSPGAKYIMLPLEPGCTIDVNASGGTHPNGDETANNDGWAAISGTSAAAPQLAGLAALIKSACSKLTPVQVKDIMKKTARGFCKRDCLAFINPRSFIPSPDISPLMGRGLPVYGQAPIRPKQGDP